MKSYRAADGSERLWFDPEEIEVIMEDELHKAGLFPSADHPTVNVEDLIEVHLKVKLDQHAVLDRDVLGVTEFPKGKQPAISINRDLSGLAVDLEDPLPGTVGRWRATLAHEAAHVLLHRILFEFDENQGMLFETHSVDRTATLMQCLKREVSFGGVGRDWREVQANRGMAAMLMPRTTFHAVTRRVLVDNGHGGAGQLNEAEAGLVASRLAALFRVSKQAAHIRLSTLGYLVTADPSLPMETPAL